MDASNGLGESNSDELRSRRLVRDPRRPFNQPKTSSKKTTHEETKINQVRTRPMHLTDSFGHVLELEQPIHSVIPWKERTALE